MSLLFCVKLIGKSVVILCRNCAEFLIIDCDIYQVTLQFAVLSKSPFYLNSKKTSKMFFGIEIKI